jgi:hypothetical protein
MPERFRKEAVDYRDKASQLRSQAASNPAHPEAQTYVAMADRYDAMAEHAEKLAGFRARQT